VPCRCRSGVGTTNASASIAPGRGPDVRRAIWLPQQMENSSPMRDRAQLLRDDRERAAMVPRPASLDDRRQRGPRARLAAGNPPRPKSRTRYGRVRDVPGNRRISAGAAGRSCVCSDRLRRGMRNRRLLVRL
jgi:hypothetical protein